MWTVTSRDARFYNRLPEFLGIFFPVLSLQVTSPTNKRPNNKYVENYPLIN